MLFFFLVFVSFFNFIIIPKDKDDNKESIEVIGPNNFFLPFLT